MRLPERNDVVPTGAYPGATHKTHRGNLWDVFRSLGARAGLAGRPTLNATATLTNLQTGFQPLDCSGGNRTFTLMATNGADTEDTFVELLRTDTTTANTCTIALNSGQTFAAGQTSITLGPRESVRLHLIGAVWHVLDFGGHDKAGIRAALGVPSAAPPKRQTVISGPVDTNGAAAFGGATGGTTITTSGTLEISASNGTADRRASITNGAWSGFSTNGTHYMFLEANADGTCTPIRVTLAPTYRQAGADVVTNNQHTFNIKEMQMKVGNGSTAAQTWRVCVGEATVSGGVVSSIRWYALSGEATQPTQTNIPSVGTGVNYSHNLGLKPRHASLKFVCKNAIANLAVGEEIFADKMSFYSNPNFWFSSTISVGALSAKWAVPSTATGFLVINSSTGAAVSVASTDFDHYLHVERGW